MHKNNAAFHAERESVLAHFLQDLHQKEPQAKVLADMGFMHAVLAEILQKEGVEATHRTLGSTRSDSAARITDELKRVAHRLPGRLEKGEMESLYQRDLLRQLLVPTGLPMEQLEKLSQTLTPEELGELYAQLEKPGGDLTARASEWLKAHGKL